MSIGLNRKNDTPIGGASEFRANFEAGVDFPVDSIPVFDGEKFVPGSATSLALGYGGLVLTALTGFVANGDIKPWNDLTPFFGVPSRVSASIADGTISGDNTGVYEIKFTANCTNLVNGVDYDFRVAVNGVPAAFGARIQGAIQIPAQTVAFTVQVRLLPSEPLSVQCTTVSGTNTLDINSATFTVTRIG